MNPNLITLLISSLVVAAACIFRMLNPEEPAFTPARYYTWAAILTGSILMVISLIRLVTGKASRPVESERHGSDLIDERRDAYRLIFDGPPRPVFLQKFDGPQSVPVFTCPVWDVSETGISLDCSGVYSNGQTVQGEIIFDSGRTVPVNGVVTRSSGNRTALRLHCTIDPPLLMAEQRERITMEKEIGPIPPVDRTGIDPSRTSLPSHQPKGVCRLKRS